MNNEDTEKIQNLNIQFLTLTLKNIDFSKLLIQKGLLFFIQEY